MLLHDFTSGFTLWHLARPTLDGVAFQYIWIAFDAFAQRSVACWWLSRHHGSCRFWHWPSSLRLLTATDSGQDLSLAGLIQQHWLKDFQMRVGANVLGSRCRINMVDYYHDQEYGLYWWETDFISVAGQSQHGIRAKLNFSVKLTPVQCWTGRAKTIQHNIRYIFKILRSTKGPESSRTPFFLCRASYLYWILWYFVTEELMPNGLERSPDRSTAPMAKRIPQQLMPSATSVRCVAFRPSLVCNIVSEGASRYKLSYYYMLYGDVILAPGSQDSGARLEEVYSILWQALRSVRKF